MAGTPNGGAVQLFSIVDYVVFALLLAVSAAIGIYHGFCGGKQKTTQEFLMGDRQMSVLPVSMSLMASFMSAIALLGTPAEMYIYGTQYWVIWVGYTITMAAAAYIFLPVFYEMRITSVFEYLEKRFNRAVRLIACVIQILQMVMYMAIVLYAPCLALNAVTGINLWASVFAIGIVCTFYTTIGGIKAVMWTDTFQMMMMFIGLFAILIKGGIDHGGYGNMFQMMHESGRLNFFDFDPDPRTRHSVWGLIFGGAFTWIAIYGVNQAQVQRCLTCKTLPQARLALLLNIPGLFALVTICSLTGIVCYAQFKNCDPLSAGRISANDQLLPLYVMDALGHLHGLPGLFTAAIFSGSLSTVSSGLNSLAALTLEDFVRPLCFPNLSEKRATILSKLMAMGYGVVCILLTFVAAQLGGVLQAALGLFGMLSGPQLGLYTLGILFPCANSTGAIVGFVVGVMSIMWIGLGQQIYRPAYVKAPVSIQGCDFLNMTLANVTSSITSATDVATDLAVTSSPVAMAAEDMPGYISLYKVSYIWFSLISVVAVVLVGLIASVATGGRSHTDDEHTLFTPVFDVFCCCLPERIRRKLRCNVVYKKDNKYTDEKDGQANRDPLLMQNMKA